MKIRNPFALKCLGFAGSFLVRGWFGTLAVRRGGFRPADPRRERFVYAVWHETLLSVAAFRTRIHFLISQHADGELVAQACRQLGIGVVRGSTTRGGAGGLWSMIEAGRRTHLGITPDGPRGPRRVVQHGTPFLASQTGLPVVPVGVGYSNAWRARSWDRFAVPVPGSVVAYVAGEPIAVPRGLMPRDLEPYRDRIQERMLAATDEAERLATGRPRRNQIRVPAAVPA